MTDAEVDQAMAQLDTLDKMTTLNGLIEDGQITWGDYAVIVADGAVSADEMTVAMGGTIEPMTDAQVIMEGLGIITGETSDQLNSARLKAISLQAILAKFTDIEFTVTGNFIINGMPSMPSIGPGGSLTPAGSPKKARQHGGPVSSGGAYVVGLSLIHI